MTKYEISINYIDFNEGSAVIGWSCKGIGFGQLTIYNSKENKDMFYVDTECMSDEFRDAVLKEAWNYIINNQEK